MVYCLRRQREREEEGGSSEQDKDCSCERENEADKEEGGKPISFFNVGKERGRIHCILWNTYISQTHETPPPGPPFGSAAPSGASAAAAASGTKAKPDIRQKRERDGERKKVSD